MAINGENTEGMIHLEAQNAIKRSQTLKLNLKRWEGVGCLSARITKRKSLIRHFRLLFPMEKDIKNVYLFVILSPQSDNGDNWVYFFNKTLLSSSIKPNKWIITYQNDIFLVIISLNPDFGFPCIFDQLR